MRPWAFRRRRAYPLMGRSALGYVCGAYSDAMNLSTMLIEGGADEAGFTSAPEQGATLCQRLQRIEGV